MVSPCGESGSAVFRGCAVERVFCFGIAGDLFFLFSLVFEQTRVFSCLGLSTIPYMAMAIHFTAINCTRPRPLQYSYGFPLYLYCMATIQVI